MTTKSRTYKGLLIRECAWVTGEHPGRWIVQIYHETGIPYSDELCPHYRSLAQAKAVIDDELRGRWTAETFEDGDA